MHFSLYQTNFKARKMCLFFSLKRSLQKRKKVPFFSVGIDLFKSAKKGTFSAVKNVPIKRAKKEPFFAVGSDVIVVYCLLFIVYLFMSITI